MQSKKIILRAFEKEDVKLCWEWFNKEEIWQYTFYGYPTSIDRWEKFYEENKNNPDRKIFIIETKNKKTIGICSLNQINWQNSNCALAIYIGEKNYWNKGCGSEAINLLLKLAFNELNLHKVYLEVAEYNTRAIKCYEKCGFKKEATFNEEIYKNGKYCNLVRMGVFKRGFVKDNK